jgi:anti-sigma regulatory factor (Ser/Thr protein kinase)
MPDCPYAHAARLPAASPFVTPNEHRSFIARMTMLAETAAFVEDFCARHGIERDDRLRLTLIVEELFTNTVVHGHGGGADAAISIELSRDDGDVNIFYEDSAPAFDVLAMMATAPDVEAPIDSRVVGGLGVYLVGQLVCAVRYAYDEGKNRVWLTMRCGREDP